ncbi:hypothetical protein AA11825_2248 [Acetobacter pomorum DSM 11825]|nr:hypothetical protein AA11825_2248 [Acetobacter pomorum DSM 11825]
MIRSEMAKYPFDHTSFTPAAQSPVHVFPVPETGRKVAPWNARTIAIQHSFYEKAVVCSSASDMTLTTGEEVLYPLPLVIA